MASLPQQPPRPFREAVLQQELELRGEHARAFQFLDGLRDPRRGLVCLAGMGANGRSFARQRPLAKDHFVLMLNTPNVTPSGVDPLEFAADAVEEFIDHERLDRPYLMGSSFGGAVATTVAARRSSRIAGLILVSPVLARSQIPLAFPGFVDAMEAPDPIARFMAPLAVQIMGGFTLDRDARDEIVRESRNFTSAELKRRLQTLLALDLIPRAKTLNLPIAWLHGARDLLVPWRKAQKAAEAIGAERFVLIRGAGHLPYLSHPTLFNDAAAEYLAAHAPQETSDHAA